jgi:hypothetical protein
MTFIYSMAMLGMSTMAAATTYSDLMTSLQAFNRLELVVLPGLVQRILPGTIRISVFATPLFQLRGASTSSKSASSWSGWHASCSTPHLGWLNECELGLCATMDHLYGDLAHSNCLRVLHLAGAVPA